MKLFYSATSPYVRKVVVLAREVGVIDRLELAKSAAHPISRNQDIVAKNPLGKVATLVLDDGQVLFDSRVICAYLDAEQEGRSMYPAAPADRWRALTQEAMADGLLDAALLVRYEQALRPEQFRWSDWTGGQMAKINSSLDAIEDSAGDFSAEADIGSIATGCALGYLDFRFADMNWRQGRAGTAAWFEQFSARPSMRATEPTE